MKPLHRGTLTRPLSKRRAAHPPNIAPFRTSAIGLQPHHAGGERACGRERGGRGDGGPHFFNYLKNILTNQKIKMNFDCTIKFVSINPSKQDLTWIHLDKIYRG
jgi:hypothetical protein